MMFFDMLFFLIFHSVFASEPTIRDMTDSTLFSSQPTEEQRMEQNAILKEYQKKSAEILIGTLLGTHDSADQLGIRTLVDIDVERWIRGKGKKGIHSRQLPYRSPYVSGDPTTVSPILIKGYKVLVFLNKYGAVVDGNAIFVLVNGYAFRHRRPDIFSNPLYERKWKEGNPHEDYLMYNMLELEKSILEDNVFGIFRDWF